MSDGTHSGRSASGRQRAVAAARELSDALWDSLQQELSRDSYERARVLAQQLGEIASTIALLVGDGGGLTSTGTYAHTLAGNATAHPGSTEDAQASNEFFPEKPEVSAGEQQPAERRTPPAPIQPSAHSLDLNPDLEEYSRGRLVDEQELATIMPFAPADDDGAGQSQIAIPDTDREEDGPAAWISLVGRSIARHAEDHLPFAVLLVEIIEVAHLERSATPHDLHQVVAQIESALARGMRVVDELSRETLGRYWLLAPDTNDTGARMLAERLAQLVRESISGGQPMEVAIGIAVCPQDGTEAPTLTATADLGVYTARLTGRSVVHTQPPEH